MALTDSNKKHTHLRQSLWVLDKNEGDNYRNNTYYNCSTSKKCLRALDFVYLLELTNSTTLRSGVVVRVVWQHICVNVVQDGTRRLSFRKLGAMHHAQRGTPLMETICTDITDKIALQMAQIIPRHRVFPADAR